MKKTQVLKLLRENRNERGIANWKKLGPKKTSNLKSYGIGLTQLRKLAKEIGRDHSLAQLLWKSDIYDVKVIGLLIDDPKQISRAQAEKQVEELNAGMLAHVFASCGAPLAKAPLAFELACDWIESSDAMRRRCGYTLIYELSKRNIKAMDEAYFMDTIAEIQDKIDDETKWVKAAMAGALMGIGKRNKRLNKAAVAAATEIGPIDIDYGPDNNCEPLDVLKHLTSDYLKQKFAKMQMHAG